MWYSRVVASLGSIPEFIEHYEKELDDARKEVGVYGNIEKNLAGLPGITERRFNQLQEIEAVLNYLNIQLRKMINIIKKPAMSTVIAMMITVMITTTKSTIITVISMIILIPITKTSISKQQLCT